MKTNEIFRIAVVFCVTVLIYVSIATLHADEAKPNLDKNWETHSIAHRIRWTHWVDWEGTEVFIDGSSIGKGSAAALKLADMNFAKGAKLQIDLPEMPDGAISGINKAGLTVPPFFRNNNFLQKWLLQGVAIQFLIAGKAQEFHTLAAVDEEGNALIPSYAGFYDPRGLTSGIFYFDGKRYDTVEGTVYAMGGAEWKSGSVLMVCVPENAVDLAPTPRPSNGIESVLRFLRGRKVMQAMLGLPPF